MNEQTRLIYRCLHCGKQLLVGPGDGSLNNPAIRECSHCEYRFEFRWFLRHNEPVLRIDVTSLKVTSLKVTAL
jgi:DNA-directed RNA polymerase subunit RPC12/RpoP